MSLPWTVQGGGGEDGQAGSQAEEGGGGGHDRRGEAVGDLPDGAGEDLP